MNDLNENIEMGSPDFKPDFVLFGTIDLEKSLTKDNEGKRLVFGEISNTDRDEQKESLIQKSLDFSYFDSNGVIKYEHGKGPENVIGKPLHRLTNERCTIIKGVLFPKGHRCADATWEMIEYVEKLNKSLPPDQQMSVGWSLEGDYVDKKRSYGGAVKGAKIYNVVITPNPVLKSTYLRMMQEHNAPILKSLCATPVETDVSKKTGGDAIVAENIDNEIKSTVVDPEVGKDGKKKKKKDTQPKNDKQEEYVMKSFKTYQEAVEHFVSLGRSQEEADELAKSLDLTKEEVGGGEELSGIKKSLADIKGFIMNLGKSNPGGETIIEPEEIEADPDLEETEVDATEFLKGLADGNERIFTGLEAISDALEKSLNELVEIVGTLSEKVDGMEKSLTVEGHPIGEAVHVLMKSRVGYNLADVTKFNLGITTPQPDGEGTGTFGKLHAKLEKSVSAGKITIQEQVQAENAFRIGGAGKDVLDSITQKCE